MKEHTIDASNRPIGRVASEAALLLMGKDTPAFRKNTVADVTVTIENASKAKIGPKKMKEKVYLRHTGFPGGQRQRTLAEVIEKKGYGEVFEKAVYGMLPPNRLRSVLMKKLIVTE